MMHYLIYSYINGGFIAENYYHVYQIKAAKYLKKKLLIAKTVFGIWTKLVRMYHMNWLNWVLLTSQLALLGPEYSGKK